MAIKTTTSQVLFVKRECANYMEHYQICVQDDEACDVLGGQRCGYFEKRVLGPPSYPYKLPGYDYAKLFAQYAEITGAEHGKVRQRKCECGTPLQLRQRVCPKCQIIQRRHTYRKYRKSKSLMRHS